MKKLKPSPRCDGPEPQQKKKKKMERGRQGKGGKKAAESGLIPDSMRKEAPPTDNGDKNGEKLLSLAELVLAAAPDGRPPILVENQQESGANNCRGGDECAKVGPIYDKDGGVQPIVGGEPGQAPTSRMK